MAQPIIDIHAHIREEETVALVQKEAPRGAPRLTPISDMVELIRSLEVSETAKAAVLGGAAAKLLSLDAPAPARAAGQA